MWHDPQINGVKRSLDRDYGEVPADQCKDNLMILTKRQGLNWYNVAHDRGVWKMMTMI